MTASEHGFTVEQAVETQRRLRSALNLGEERFELPAFIGMISDEIEQMRAAGRPDRDVLDVIEAVTGARVAEADLARFYAQPNTRQRDGA